MATPKASVKKAAPMKAKRPIAIAKIAEKAASVKKTAAVSPAMKAATTKAPAKAPTTAAKKPLAKSVAVPAAKSDLTPVQRYMMVADAAYYRAERQGFMGDPVQDWIFAEAEIATLLCRRK